MFFWRHDIGPQPGRWGVRFAVTSRRGGVSARPWDELNLGGRTGDDPEAVEVNRAALAYELGVPRQGLLLMNQCHGADVVVAEGPWAGEPPTADGVVTARDDLAVAALAADCVPLLLADPRAGVVAAVHAGRPGLLAGVVGAALDTMAGVGSTTTEVLAVVGPSVCGRCYEVPPAMRAEVAAVSPVTATVSWAGTPALDVAAGVVDELVRRGTRVTWVPGCTREHPDLYSYRRDGQTGRFAAVVRLLPEDGHPLPEDAHPLPEDGRG